MDELEKIDLIRERLGVTYSEAQAALEKADGDVIKALIDLENKHNQWEEKLQDQGKRLLDQIKEIIQKGNVTRIKLKKNDEIVAEIPATLGAAGILGVLASTQLAIVAGIGTVAAMLNQYSLEIEKENGEIEKEDLKI